MSTDNLYAPNLTEPVGGEVYNKGTVSFAWDIKDPPTSSSDITLDDVNYELEYTEKYVGRETVWHVIRRRISGRDTSYEWRVGRMLKGETIRFRIRSFCESLNLFSEYSQGAADCSINVFKIVNPVFLSPESNKKYSNFISIILDETELINTYNQRVRYKIEYQSEDADVAWTVLFEDLSVGSSPLRWNIDNLAAADDYQLKLTVYDKNNNQVTVAYVQNISVTHPGLFYIDTKPPTGVVRFETNNVVTNVLDQIVNVYVDDETTDVKTMSLRSKNLTGVNGANIILTLGPVDGDAPMFDPVQTESDCATGFTSEMGYVSKVGWKFNDESGLMKLDAKLSDYGGNTSCQDKKHFFMPIWSNSDTLTDFITTRESRDYLVITDNVPSTVSKNVNTAYIGTSTGKLYKLEPYPTLLYNLVYKISKLVLFNDLIYVFLYKDNIDVSQVYRYDRTNTVTLLHEFTDVMSEITAVAEYSSYLFFGMKNGQLWRFDGSSFSNVHTFTRPISYLTGDSRYLYIGFFGGTEMYVYDTTNFISFDIEI